MKIFFSLFLRSLFSIASKLTEITKNTIIKYILIEHFIFIYDFKYIITLINKIYR